MTKILIWFKNSINGEFKVNFVIIKASEIYFVNKGNMFTKYFSTAPNSLNISGLHLMVMKFYINKILI